uniref:RING-type domain-containing protein n=1 Tax=Cyanistes caeruleus TaxID=156563 RepID=A0A8C0V2A4_CYACU
MWTAWLLSADCISGLAFECPICLDTIEEETSVSWCRHTFCFPCILEWLCAPSAGSLSDTSSAKWETITMRYTR